MHLVYFDESGNTGHRLDDPDQPIFLLGALAAAVLTAASLGILAHETLGIARAEIRIDALGGAALLAIVSCASYFREPPP